MRTLFIPFIATLSLMAQETATYPITEVIKETESQYSQALLKLMRNWPPKTLKYEGEEERPLFVKVYQTPGNIDYIGVEEGMKIQAPLSAVEKVIEDVAHYADLFPGFADIHVTHADSNQFEVFWEKVIPVFFIKNIKYKITYTVDRSQPNRRFYRSQLSERKGLKACDVLTVIEGTGAETRYAEYNFFDGDFGIVTTLAPDKIWTESIRTAIHSALARKLRSENPLMNFADIRTQVEKEVAEYPIEKFLKEKTVFGG